jgi:L-threonylcarbamoyladenylate synthase
MPEHPMALELILRAGIPLVAPSANRSGRPSATTWQAVVEDLDGRIDGVVCGPATTHGLESTVVDPRSEPPAVLRHGAIPMEALMDWIPNLVDRSQLTGIQDTGPHGPVASPGLLHRHYQPRARVAIAEPGIDGNRSSKGAEGRRAWIGLHPPSEPGFEVCEVHPSIEAYAAHLFDFFRRMDQQAMDCIVCERVPREGLGRALMDRLQRASADRP